MRACKQIVAAIESGKWQERGVVVQALYELVKQSQALDARLQRCEDAIGLSGQNLDEVDGSLQQVWTDLDGRVKSIERQLEVSGSDYKMRIPSDQDF